MTYCPSCGAPNEAGSTFCQRCGASLSAGAPGTVPPPPPAAAADRGLDSNEKTLIFLGNLCISPLLGIVLYFVWKDGKPQRSKDVCSLTLWTFGVYVILFGLAMCAVIAGGIASS